MTMNGLNVEETIDLIEQLLKLKIGDEGRLLYIKNSLNTGKKIYETDKKYLEQWREKIKKINVETKKPLLLSEENAKQELNIIGRLEKAEIGNPQRLLTIKKALTEGIEMSDENHQYLNKKFEQLVKTDENEKMFYEAIKVIEKLQEVEIGNSERLQSIQNTLLKGSELNLQDIKYFNEKADALKELEDYEKILSEKKEKVTPSTIKTSTVKQDSTPYELTVNLKIFDIVVWAASISFTIWIFGLLVADLGPIHGPLLGLAAGLGICGAVIRKIQGKFKQVQP
ncbi:MAG: hypothetical protein IH841_06140 [Thaumarchaeota archaeon]|nr:hypothetical protein [Nitrososphaerota archaeon]